MGINGPAQSWFESYLSGRSQKVLINSVTSDPCDLDISVIQSTLGPILNYATLTIFGQPLGNSRSLSRTTPPVYTKEKL